MQLTSSLSLITSLGVLFGVLPSIAAPGPQVSYYKQVRPIIKKRCQGCHQPLSQGGKLILTSYEAFKGGGATGPGFKPGDPDGSLTVRFISGPTPNMPKNNKPLDPKEVDIIRTWIAEGAKNDTPEIKDPIDTEHPPEYRHAPVVSALAYSPDGNTLAVSGYRETLLHKADGSGLMARLVGKSVRVESLSYSPDGKLLAAAGGAPGRFGEVQFWDTTTNKLKNAVQVTFDEMYGGSFAPTGDQFAVGSADNSVRILSVPDGKTLVKMDNHSDWIFATCWTKPNVKSIAEDIAKYSQGTTNRPLMPEDTMHLLSTGRDRSIKLILAKNGSFVDDINTFTSPYRAMAARPGTNQVLVAGDDGIPRLYQCFRTKPRTMNQEDQSLLRAFEKQPGQVNAVAFNSDGSLCAVGGESGLVNIYKTDDGTKAGSFKGSADVVYSLAFRPKAKEIAAAGFDGFVRIFSLEAGKITKEFMPVPLVGTVANAK